MKTAKKKPIKKIPAKRKVATSKAVALRTEPKQDAVGVARPPRTLSLADPDQVMGFGKVLNSFIVKNKLSVKIQGNDYAMVDGWKFAGMNFGLSAIPQNPVKKSARGEYIRSLSSVFTYNKKGGGTYEKEQVFFIGSADDDESIRHAASLYKVTNDLISPFYSYECECDVVNIMSGVRVNHGNAICTNMEDGKAGYAEYAVSSMAQTRAIGKGFRNLLGFVMKAGGFQATPADEIPPNGFETPAGNKPPDPKLPACTEKQYNSIIDRIIAGDKGISLEKIKSAMNLTDEQEQGIMATIRLL